MALDGFCKTAAQFSRIAADLGDVISEMDMNPVIVNSEGCVVVDALVVGNGNQGG